jgi:CHRD domain/PEP-CTERM motif
MNKLIIAVVSIAFGCAAAVDATPITYTADLSGLAEVPPNASPGTGFAKIVFDDVAHTLSVDVTFADLIGTTTASHIHCCTAVPEAGTAGVATQTPFFVGFPIGVTSGTYSHAFDLTQAASWNAAFITSHGGTPASAEAALGAGLLAGEAYLNVHSQFAQGGEIRGFLTPAPEPGTLMLLGLGLGGLALKRRRSV